ncbi:hypothetical protein NQ315_017569 [Exocentrus adspersus]|uniref:Integrase zinc-binding domain-containing protein n=1 Tax=Exocentrus adspersus TaxID=1586481 RepID=A0AAV8VIU7_9CUCU|nr:hypothetical protein NQ315_017569 [Exocentrus adspersus]
MYVDDVVTGCTGVEEAAELKKQLLSLMNSGRFTLHKWNNLGQLSIPRHWTLSPSQAFELHGFCDASEKGYACVIYLRIVKPENLETKLLCAKSRVAPLKRISIPRLELCAAVLLADLMSYVMNLLKGHITFEHNFAWTDSKVALCWIKSPPYRWKTFIANRVNQIQENLPPQHWRFVNSTDNPADAASRGLLPTQLLHHTLWWAGPAWLLDSSSPWLNSIQPSEPDSPCLDKEKKLVPNVVDTDNCLDSLLEKFSSLTRIQRVLAYVLIKHVQRHAFAQQISLLHNNKPLSKPFRKLNIFLDSDGLLRTGGRIVHARLSYDKRHPLLLPSHHKLTYLIIEQTRKRYLHPGYQTLLFILAQRYWILSAKRVIRSVLNKCLKCWKTNPQASSVPMADLPQLRVSQLKPFSCVGVDYGGPFTMSLGKLRGTRTHKAYGLYQISWRV